MATVKEQDDRPLSVADRLVLLADHVAAELADGLIVGLGSGSTAEAVVRAIGARVADGLSIVGVPTSENTARLARSLGIPLQTLDEVDVIDLGIDGADEIDPNLDLVKGAGGAHLYEKLVALACRDYLVVAASEKLVDRLGTRMPLPVEIIPLGSRGTMRRLEAVGCRPTLRVRDGVPFVTDQGAWIVDCETGPIDDALALGSRVKAVTGVVEHGIFAGIARRATVVHPDGRIETFDRRVEPSSAGVVGAFAVTYVEIPVTDLPRAVSFYHRILGLPLELTVIDGHEMALFPASDGPGASGALALGVSYVPSLDGTRVYLAVEDVEATLRRAVEAGGEVLYPRTAIGEHGFVAELRDSEGNRVALSSAH